MADSYDDIGPPALTNDEGARIEDLFHYSEPEVQEALRVLSFPGSDNSAREAAKETLRKWREQ